MIQLNKEKDKVIISITTQLDIEDVKELVSDLQDWILENNIPKFKGIDEKAIKEAYMQAQSKRKLEEEMRTVFVDLFDSQYIEKMAKVYELDPKTKEVIIKDVKLNEQKKK